MLTCKFFNLYFFRAKGWAKRCGGLCSTTLFDFLLFKFVLLDGVCRTALATPGMLIIDTYSEYNFKAKYLKFKGLMFLCIFINRPGVARAVLQTAS